MPYLSVAKFWKYQNADVWKKTKTHPPWFKFYVHRDREIDALPPLARLLWYELLGVATRYENVIGVPVDVTGLNEAEAKLKESVAKLNWICTETRMEPEVVTEMLPLLVKGGWLSETKTTKRSRRSSRKNLEDPRDQDVDVDREEDKESAGSGSSTVKDFQGRTEARPPGGNGLATNGLGEIESVGTIIEQSLAEATPWAATK